MSGLNNKYVYTTEDNQKFVFDLRYNLPMHDFSGSHNIIIKKTPFDDLEIELPYTLESSEQEFKQVHILFPSKDTNTLEKAKSFASGWADMVCNYVAFHFKLIESKQPTIKILRSEYEKIKNTIGKIPAESGGILLGSRDEKNKDAYVVEKFIFDNNANTTTSTYTFDHVFLNQVLQANHPELQFIGAIHSHPSGCRRLSQPDRSYFSKLFNSINAKMFLTPIIMSEADSGFEFIPYITYKDDPFNPVQAELKIIEEIKKNRTRDFSRIEEAVNVELLQNAEITIVGAGGSFSLCESLVRSGVSNLNIIDFDTVDDANVTRQGYYPKDFGKLKINALEEHLKTINPNLNFQGYNQRVQDLSKLQKEHLFGKADLLLFLTDSFEAQAWGNKVALEYEKPAVWAGFYEGSKAAEVFFYIPNVTPACMRCALSARYKVQESAKEEIKASSAKNTIFHSQYLDSIIGMLSMAILHNNTKGFEYSNWFGNKWEHNFFLLRLHPDYSNQEGNLFKRTFEKSPKGSVFNFNSLFQKVEIEEPPKYDYTCPDCNGLGNDKIPKAVLDSAFKHRTGSV